MVTIRPENQITFPLNFGCHDNDMSKSFRFSWENQNMDVHQNSHYKVMNALLKFKTDLLYNTNTRLNIYEFIDTQNIHKSIDTHLVDFYILNNNTFKGLDSSFKKSYVNPANYTGSPLMVTFDMIDIDYATFNLIKNRGRFFIRGEGELNYVRGFDNIKMVDYSYSHITEFTVNQLCYYTTETDSVQVLFG